eukprot:1708814-Rhodomonas_salina.2
MVVPEAPRTYPSSTLRYVHTLWHSAVLIGYDTMLCSYAMTLGTTEHRLCWYLKLLAHLLHRLPEQPSVVRAALSLEVHRPRLKSHAR